LQNLKWLARLLQGLWRTNVLCSNSPPQESRSVRFMKELNMENNFKSVFNALQNEVVWLHARFLSYEKLYGKSEERIALLNASAPSFFHHLQFILLDDIELFLCKLLDPAKQRSKENLTLEQLIEFAILYWTRS